MRLLALDTATRHATVALCEDSSVLAEAEQEVTTHSEGLLSLIEQVLQRAGREVADLDAVVCGRGPGSFTGLRIGMATAKGLCLASGKPLLCVSSLLPLAMATAEALGADRLVAAILDARREEVFCGLFRHGAPVGTEILRRPAALVVDLSTALGADHPTDPGIPLPRPPLLLAGDGALLYRDLLLERLGDRAALAPESCHAIRARYLALAALPRAKLGYFDDLQSVVPSYLRPSDARLPVRPG